MLLGTPVVKLSQALGRYEGRLNRAVARWMLSKHEKIFARGDDSERMTRALDLGEGRVEQAPDIAFCYREAHSLTEENDGFAEAIVERLRALRDREREILVLSVSAVVFAKCEKKKLPYLDTMARVAEHFLERGYAVVLFPNATREGVRSTRNNDLPIIERIAARVRSPHAERLVRVDRDLNTASLRRVLRACDYLVASRFHAMIAGLSLGLPTMVIGWGHKYREVLAQLGIEDHAYDYGELELESLIARIEAFLEQADEVRARIARRIDAVRERSARQFEWLAAFLVPRVEACTPDDEPAPAPGASAPRPPRWSEPGE
jgi:polysaccharide pyruvyl transferase WcaK-like protein